MLGRARVKMRRHSRLDRLCAVRDGVPPNRRSRACFEPSSEMDVIFIVIAGAFLALCIALSPGGTGDGWGSAWNIQAWGYYMLPCRGVKCRSQWC